MKNVVRIFVVGLALSFSIPTVSVAADKAPVAAATTYKVGDKVRVCGCGTACACNTLQTTAGKCHCGKDLIEATVTKVEGDKVTVKSANGEQVITAKKA